MQWTHAICTSQSPTDWVKGIRRWAHCSCLFSPLTLLISLVWALCRGVVFSLPHHPQYFLSLFRWYPNPSVWRSLPPPDLLTVQASSPTTCPLLTGHVGWIPDPPTWQACPLLGLVLPVTSAWIALLLIISGPLLFAFQVSDWSVVNSSHTTACPKGTQMHCSFKLCKHKCKAWLNGFMPQYVLCDSLIYTLVQLIL